MLEARTGRPSDWVTRDPAAKASQHVCGLCECDNAIVYMVGPKGAVCADCFLALIETFRVGEHFDVSRLRLCKPSKGASES